MPFKRKKPKEPIKYIDDELFGRLTFIKESGDDNHWFGAVPFNNNTIEIKLYGDDSKIDNTQKALFKEFENRYKTLEPKIEEFINHTLKEKKIEKSIYSIQNDFEISHISLFNSKKNELEISYKLKNDFYWFEIHLQEIYTYSFRNFRIKKKVSNKPYHPTTKNINFIPSITKKRKTSPYEDTKWKKRSTPY